MCTRAICVCYAIFRRRNIAYHLLQAYVYVAEDMYTYVYVAEDMYTYVYVAEDMCTYVFVAEDMYTSKATETTLYTRMIGVRYAMIPAVIRV